LILLFLCLNVPLYQQNKVYRFYQLVYKNKEPPPDGISENDDGQISDGNNPQCGETKLTTEELREYLLKLDQRLNFTEEFYTEAIKFLYKHSLDLKYAYWFYNYSLKQNPNDFMSFYYKSFFKEFHISDYKFAHGAPMITTDLNIKCPVCGAVHDRNKDCPQCKLPRGSEDKDLDKRQYYHIYFVLSPETREQYWKEQYEANGLYDHTLTPLQRIMRHRAVKIKYGIPLR